MEVVIGTLDNQLKDFKINEQDELKYHLLKIENNSLITENGFKADCIIVNNDMTAGSPKVLQNITQPILPPVGMGWYQRQKKHNLDCYKKIIGEFAKEFQINENLISTEYSFCKNINFKERKGLDCIANQVEKVLFKIKENYKQLNIKDKPYVFLKANRGTYGMGIMTAQSGDEIYEINKKNRNKMAVIRDNTQNAEIIIQEGVKTEKTYQNHPCEAFIYQIAGKTAGMIYRINKNKDQFSNLNSHGVEFKAIDKENIKDEYFLYDLIASLSSLAASYE